ncbi:L,D-transpeptidase [Sulfurovum sp.]|uniref:L,D-transpeptidase family protein n=1 Tax=Sulfurovum sp. TaxID=1969726 RepID=UPI003567E136
MKIVLALCLTLVTLQAQTKQLLVVTTKSWSTPTGSMQRYELHDRNWQKVGKEIDIKLGRNGLGWGIGLHEIPQDAKIIKKEGDGKAPAGIFRLRQAFGYAPFNIEYPYEVYKETDHCVDDVNSMFYNKIVDSTKIERDYESHERMKFSQNYYKFGIVVDHNGITEGAKSKRGAGSCIFIHIKSVPTAGCTVMNGSQIQEVLRWLDPKGEPLLLQGTESVVETLWESVR